MKQYIVDAFTDKIFHGNQAAVCVMEDWIPDGIMMDIAKENNFSETAFAVREGNGYRLRWFTPGSEVDLCGHATLGTAYVLFRYYEAEAESIVFHTMSGDLFVGRRGDFIEMDFPSYRCNETAITDMMTEAMGATPVEAYIDRDLLLVYEDEETVRRMMPSFGKVELLEGMGVCVTAPGKGYDCVSRFFAPKIKVDEDPVTGSVHCMAAPYWASRLGKQEIHAYQASERGGELRCVMKGDRVIIAGRAALYSVGELNIHLS